MLTDEQRAQGWKEHDGGPCPVDGEVCVSVLFRDGVIYHEPEPAGGIFWPTERRHHPHDIIAYKPKDSHYDR